ncbi:phage tail protein [Paenibacillus sp. 2TAB19]|uniref:phage tail protein n=1 Tax=Paenibacillus sp. 2TAB19 TaxID=3233003 RepID=UPI003F9B12C4
MSGLGSFGPVVFVVSGETLRTFDDLKRTSASRWAKHDVIGRRPLTQYVGQGLDTISFTMRFDVAYGLNPRKEMDVLRNMEREAGAHALIVGGKGFGTGFWIITGLDQSLETIDSAGNVIAATVTINLEEYVP